MVKDFQFKVWRDGADDAVYVWITVPLGAGEDAMERAADMALEILEDREPAGTSIEIV